MVEAVPSPLHVNEEIVALLEHLLGRAKTGEIRAVACAAVLRNGDSLTTIKKSTEISVFTLLGTAHHLTQRLYDDMVESRPETDG